MALNEADVLAGLKEIVEEVAGVPAASIEMGKSFTEAAAAAEAGSAAAYGTFRRPHTESASL